MVRSPPRRVLKYAVLAAVMAVCSIAAVETMGTFLTRSYTGLGGKLEAAPSAAAPASSNMR